MTDFAATKSQYIIPVGIIYLDGNSLGPLPKSAASLVQNILEEEWGKTAHFGLE